MSPLERLAAYLLQIKLFLNLNFQWKGDSVTPRSKNTNGFTYKKGVKGNGLHYFASMPV